MRKFLRSPNDDRRRRITFAVARVCVVTSTKLADLGLQRFVQNDADSPKLVRGLRERPKLHLLRLVAAKTNPQPIGLQPTTLCASLKRLNFS